MQSQPSQQQAEAIAKMCNEKGITKEQLEKLVEDTKALKEYQAKVIETIGEKKEKVVRDAVAKDQVDKNPVSTREVIITGSGKTLCFDVFSKRYFESDMETLRSVINSLNKRMLDEMFVTVADLHYEIGLPPSKNSEDLGWHVDNGLIDVHFSSHVTDDGRTALVMEYYVEPRYI